MLSLQNMNKKTKLLIYCAACLLVVIAAAGILWSTGFFGKTASNTVSNADSTLDNMVSDNKLAEISIEPVKADKNGVELTSGFKLLFQNKTSREEIGKMLEVSPAQSYKLKSVSGTEFILSFNEALKSNNIYRFNISDNKGAKRSWAFQTKKSFRVVRTLPRDKATYVPVDSGIEITFSHENTNGLTDFFEIEPAVKGRFESHGKTIVFVPESLDYSTVYKIKIKKGLELSGSDDTLGEDYIFEFQTEAKVKTDESNYLSFSKDFYNFTTKTEPALEVYVSDRNAGSQASCEVYKYQDINGFLTDLKKNWATPYWAIPDRSKIQVDTKALEKVMTFNTKIQRMENSSFISFPSALGEGHYLLKIQVNDTAVYTYIQCNDASVYAMAAKGKSLVWINDAGTGKAINGAVVESSGKKAISDKEGIAVLEGELKPILDSGRYLFNVKCAGKPAFAALAGSGYSYYEYNWGGANNDYWTYMYTDKGIYLPNDIINVWGILKSRKGAVPDKAELQLYKSDYYYFEENGLPGIETQEVKLSRLGGFTGKIPVDSLNPGYYYIKLVLDGKTITENYFQIMQYTKPAYKLESTIDKKVAFSWDKASLNVNAAFFEGSPVPGLELNYYWSLNGSQKKGKLTCDNAGLAQMKLDPSGSTTSWHPQYLTVTLENSKPEEEEISTSCNLPVFFKDTMVEVDSSCKKGKATVSIRTSLIDLIKADRSEEFDDNSYRGKPVDMNLKADIYEQYWAKREIGNYYDFINKKTVKKYDYYQVEKLVQELDLKTASGACSFDFPASKEKSYIIRVSGKDGKGSEILEERYIYGQYSPYGNARTGYSLSIDETKASYKLGETAGFDMKYNNEAIQADKNKRFLYLHLRNGLMEYETNSSPSHSVIMKDACIPNLYVKGICFDGTNVFDAGMKEIKYDYSEKDLSITLKADKESYKPGDNVKLDIDIKDKSGKPVSSEVNLSVVDEAFFAVQDQYVDTLSSIYGPSVSSGLLADYVSNEMVCFDKSMGAEKGEGGDEGTRFLFKDSACFSTIHTDADGKGSLSFRLPDNLTSWRITCQAVTENLYAGSLKTNITSKLPFFINTTSNKVYLEGDTPGLTLRTFGTSVLPSDTVTYNVSIEGPSGFKKQLDLSGKAGSYTTAKLPGLSEGDYTITASAKLSGLKDSVKFNFKVVKDMLTVKRINYYTLKENLKIDGGNGLTELAFYNNASTAFYRELYSLRWSWGQRVDQVLARKTASNMLKKYYNEDPYETEETGISQYQTQDGGIAMLTYDSSDPVLSAKVAALAKDYIDRAALKLYFYNILDNKDSQPEDVAASYWGLAALDEPVLIEIDNLLDSQNIGLTERLYLGNALAEIGDFNRAEKVYDGILSEKGTGSDSFYYINAGSGKDDIVEATSLCSIIAIKLGLPESSRMHNYIKCNSSKELLTNLERLILITNRVPDIRTSGSFSYELDGRKQTVKLEKDDIYRIILKKEKLSRIKYSDITGDIAVAASCSGPVNDLAGSGDDFTSISRSYSVGGNRTQAFEPTDFVKVTLNINFKKAAPYGCYEITDVLPSGLKYISSKTADDSEWHPVEGDGQLVRFVVFYGKKSRAAESISYYARPVSTGKYTADTAVIKYSLSNSAAFTDRTEVTVTD